MIVPPRLKRGEKIGVCAPAGRGTDEQLRAGLDRLGTDFTFQIAPSLLEPPTAGTPSYLSAPDDVRVDEFHAMLRDPDIRAIIPSRGGYGIMRILPQLDPDLLHRDPKPIVGFSDVTALLSWMHAAGVRGIHGPMINQLANVPDADVAHLVRVLTDPAPLGVRPWALASHGAGAHVGELIPANLTIASMLVGTAWALPLDGAILLFEEVGERAYEIDRYLTQLALTGALRSTRAFIIAMLTSCDDGLATVLERLHGRPTVVGAPIGHGTRNEAVPFGARVRVDLDHATVEILDGAVS